MRGHGTKFNRKMEAAVGALLTQKNQEEAARAVGISVATLLRWQKLPEFQKAYRGGSASRPWPVDRPAPAGDECGGLDAAKSHDRPEYAAFDQGAGRGQCARSLSKVHRT
jgi:hypothetical protein